MEKRNNLSNKLKKMQMEMGKSQTEFAQELGIPQSTLQNIMKGGNTTLDMLMQIAAITGFSLDELVLADPAAEILRKLLSQLNCYLLTYDRERAGRSPVPCEHNPTPYEHTAGVVPK